MQIRRKDNHSKVMLLPNNAIRSPQGWLVPVFPDFPDDLFISYLDQDWELVSQDRKASKDAPSHSLEFLATYSGMAHQN